MAVFTPEEIEAANPSVWTPGFNTARSVARTEEDFAEERRRAAEIAERSIIGAAFQQDNFVGSFFTSKAQGTSNAADPEFNLVDYLKSNDLTHPEVVGEFYGAVNKDYADALLADMRRGGTNKETLAAAGWAGVFASIAAGTVDLPSLLPGGGIVRGAKGGYSVTKTALLGSSLAAVGAGVQEAGLQATQTGRAAEESYVNIGASILLGGLIGGAAAAAMSKGERKAAEAAMGRVYDLTAPGGILKPDDSVGAARNPDAEPDIFEVRPREDFEVEGADARGAVAATKFLNPVLRATQYAANSARQHVSSLFENTIYRNMHSRGETAGASPETLINVARAREALFVKDAISAYKEMRKTGVSMSYDEYWRQVGLAIRNGDEGPNPFISRAAAALRREVLEPMKNEALRTQRSGGGFLLNESDLGLKGGDKSYAPVIYLPHVMRGKQAEWEAEVVPVIEARMQAAFDEQTAALNDRLAGYQTQLDDLAATGDERSLRIGEIEATAVKLDTEFADMAELADDLTEATAAARAAGDDFAAKEAARLAAKEAREKGGERLQEYLKRRADLRRRKRNLTSDNADAQAAKRSKLEARMEEVREADAAAVRVFSRRLKNIINQIDRNLPGRAQELLDGALAEVERLTKLMTASEKRVAKLSEVPGEQPPGLAAYVAGERAAAEEASRAARELVDQLQDIAARGVADADYDELRAALELKPVSPRGERLAKAEGAKAKRGEKLAAAEKEATERQKELSNAQRLAQELNDKLNAVAEGVSARSMRRGEYMQRAKDRAAKLTPEEIKAQSAARRATLEARAADAKARHAKDWQDVLNRADEVGVTAKAGPVPPFRVAAREAALTAFDKITGRAVRDEGLPPGVTRFSVGPLKDRTLNLPTEIHLKHGWIETDARVIASRHTRAMAAEIELTKRFGRADMADQIKEVSDEYSAMQSQIGEAGSVADINAIIGKKKYSEKADLADVKTKAAVWLRNQEDMAVKDLKAGRDLMRGDFNAAQNQTWASVSRSVRAFNYITRMGGVALASIPEIVRPAMVHGLKGYFPALGTALKMTLRPEADAATRLLVREATLMNLATQRLLNSVNVAMSDLGDPFVGKVSAIERLLEKGTRVGSRWNGINLLTDFQQNLSFIVSQHRLAKGVLGEAGQDGSFIRSAAEDTRLMAMLGIDTQKAARIRDMIEQHGEEIDGIWTPNTEAWTDEGAVRAYRAAVNLDVNSIISRKGLGDSPVFANTPGGAMLMQFSGYGMGAHSRVMIRGLQEDKARFISGLAAMSVLGGMAAWVTSYRTQDPETGRKMRERWAENPMSLLGEGLDRSGIFPLLFDVANRADRMSGALGAEYRLNPIKSPLTAMGGGSLLGNETSRASDVSGIYSGLLGPTVGTIEGLVSAGRVIGEAVQGEDAPARDDARALATLPFSSYYGIREITRWLFE